MTAEELRIALAEGERIKRLESAALLNHIDYSALSPAQQLELASGRPVRQENQIDQ